MKYELETIPVYDAFAEDSECPLCLLEERAEREYLDFFLGTSVMNPETRVEVNANGFCRVHYHAMYKSRKNRHGYGLLAHTHLMEENTRIARTLKSLASGKASPKALRTAAHDLEDRQRTCLVCSRLGERMARYVYTTLYYWKKDAEFRESYEKSRGFCGRHLPLLLRMAPDVLGGRTLGDWAAVTAALCSRAGARLEQEVEWYTKKFDHQNRDLPWGTSEDALERTIWKLAGGPVRKGE